MNACILTIAVPDAQSKPITQPCMSIHQFPQTQGIGSQRHLPQKPSTMTEQVAQVPPAIAPEVLYLKKDQ